MAGSRHEAAAQKRVPKPRNPFVALARTRVAGPHQKTARALRRAEKTALKKSAWNGMSYAGSEGD